MENADDVSIEGRVTRARRKRLVSIDSEASSRPGTPISPQRISKQNIKPEIDVLPKRVTRRSSVSNTPQKTPSKTKDIDIAEVSTPTRRSRRRTTSVHDDNTPQVSGKQQTQLSVLAEEDLKESQEGKSKIRKSPKHEKFPLGISLDLPKKVLNMECEIDSDIEVINLADSDNDSKDIVPKISPTPLNIKISPKDVSRSEEELHNSLNTPNSNEITSPELKNNGSKDFSTKTLNVIASTVEKIDLCDDFEEDVSLNNAKKDSAMIDGNTPNSSTATGEESKSIHSKSVTFENSKNLDESKTPYPKTPMLRKKGSPVTASKIISNQRYLNLTDSVMEIDGDENTDAEEDSNGNEDSNNKDSKNEGENEQVSNRKSGTPKSLKKVSIESRCSTPNVMECKAELSSTPTPEKILRSGKSYGDSPTSESNNSMKSETKEMDVSNKSVDQNGSTEIVISNASPRSKSLTTNEGDISKASAKTKSWPIFSQSPNGNQKELDIPSLIKSPTSKLSPNKVQKHTGENSNLDPSPKRRSLQTKVNDIEALENSAEALIFEESTKSKSLQETQEELMTLNMFIRTNSLKLKSPLSLQKKSPSTKNSESLNEELMPKSLETSVKEHQQIENSESVKQAVKSPKAKPQLIEMSPLKQVQTLINNTGPSESPNKLLSPVEKPKNQSAQENQIEEVDKAKLDNSQNQYNDSKNLSNGENILAGIEETNHKGESNDHSCTLISLTENLEEDISHEEESTYVKSWAQSVKKSSHKIDTLESFKESLEENKETEKIIKNAERSIKLQVDSTDEDDEDEDENEENDSVADDLGSFFDGEVKCMGRDYESGDSMDEEEREIYAENNFEDEGESIGSVDSSEGDVEEDSSDDNNSFIVASDEEDEENLILNYSDDDEHPDDHDDNSRNKVEKKKTYKRLKKMSTDTEDESSLLKDAMTHEHQDEKEINDTTVDHSNINNNVVEKKVHDVNARDTTQSESVLETEGSGSPENKRISRKISSSKEESDNLPQQEQTEIKNNVSSIKLRNSLNEPRIEVDEEIGNSKLNDDDKLCLENTSSKEGTNLIPTDSHKEDSQKKKKENVDERKNNPTEIKVESVPDEKNMMKEKNNNSEKHHLSRNSSLMEQDEGNLSHTQRKNTPKKYSFSSNESLGEINKDDLSNQQKLSFVQEKQKNSPRKSSMESNMKGFVKEPQIQETKKNLTEMKCEAENSGTTSHGKNESITNCYMVQQQDVSIMGDIGNSHFEDTENIKGSGRNRRSQKHGEVVFEKETKIISQGNKSMEKHSSQSTSSMAKVEGVFEGNDSGKRHRHHHRHKTTTDPSTLNAEKEHNSIVAEAEKTLKHRHSHNTSKRKEHKFDSAVQETQLQKTEIQEELEKPSKSNDKNKKHSQDDTTLQTMKSMKEEKCAKLNENVYKEFPTNTHTSTSHKIDKDHSMSDPTMIPPIIKRQRSKSFIDTNTDKKIEEPSKKQKLSQSFSYENNDYINIEPTSLGRVYTASNSANRMVEKQQHSSQSSVMAREGGTLNEIGSRHFTYENSDYINVEPTSMAKVYKESDFVNKNIKFSFEDTNLEKIEKIHSKNTSTPFVSKTGFVSNNDQNEIKRVLKRCNEMLEEAEKDKKINKENKTAIEKKRKIKVKTPSELFEETNSSNVDNMKLTALSHALKVSQNILTKPAKKRQREPIEPQNDENKYASKRLPPDVLQAVSSFNTDIHNVPKKHKKNDVVEEQYIERKVFKSICGDLIVESLIDLPQPKKPIPVEVIKTSTGNVRVEPISPLPKKTNYTGFRESPVTPKTTGWKMNQLLKMNGGKAYNQTPVQPTGGRKRKRRMAAIDEPTNVLPQPTWTKTAGSFKIDKVQSQRSKVLGHSGTTEFAAIDPSENVISSASERAKNFRENAIYRDNSKRENAHNLLRRKRFFH